MAFNLSSNRNNTSRGSTFNTSQYRAGNIQTPRTEPVMAPPDRTFEDRRNYMRGRREDRARFDFDQGILNQYPDIALDYYSPNTMMRGNIYQRARDKMNTMSAKESRQAAARERFAYGMLPENLRGMLSFRDFQQANAYGVDPYAYMRNRIGGIGMGNKLGMGNTLYGGSGFGVGGGRGMKASGFRSNDTGQVSGGFHDDMYGMQWFSGAGGGGGGRSRGGGGGGWDASPSDAAPGGVPHMNDAGWDTDPRGGYDFGIQSGGGAGSYDRWHAAQENEDDWADEDWTKYQDMSGEI